MAGVLGFRYSIFSRQPHARRSRLPRATEWPESHGVGRAASESPPVAPCPAWCRARWPRSTDYTAGVSQPSQRPIRGVPMLAAVSHLLLHVASAFTV
jgi:hypothetical protein